MIIYVDIDNTICESPTFGYSECVPIGTFIEKINTLYDNGHTIIYWTARGTVTGQNYFKLTLDQLTKWGCKFHELRMGKPFYDILIDDKTKRIEEI